MLRSAILCVVALHSRVPDMQGLVGISVRDMTLQLRPYQRQAIDDLNTWFAENDGNPLVVIPTAGGKSLVIATFVHEALSNWPDTRIVILTHVRELIAQNYAELVGFWPDAPAGIYSAGLNKRDIKARVLFAGIQSIQKKAYALQRVDLVLVDECHLIPRSADTMYGRFLDELRQINPYLRVVGFTATPFRLDSGLLHRGPNAVFSDIAFEANIRDLIAENYLCPPISRRASTQIDTSGVGTRLGEFIAPKLEAAATDPATVRAIAAEISAAGQDRKGWLVFGCGVRHSTILLDALRELGVTAEGTFGDTPAAERDSIIARFKRQEIRALCSMGVLTTGFNARHVDLIALARPTKSCGLYIQMVGRGTRLFPGKADCLVLDFGGNIERHGPVDAPRIKAPGEGGGEIPLKECGEREISGRFITGCGESNPIGATACCRCGEPFARESAVSTMASGHAVLSSQIQPEWLDVSDVSYRAHQKPGKPASLCVTYRCGITFHREWVCFEHDGYARQKSVQWWQKRAPALPVPNTVAEALAMQAGLPDPKRILVRPEGKFTSIVGVTL